MAQEMEMRVVVWSRACAWRWNGAYERIEEGPKDENWKTKMAAAEKKSDKRKREYQCCKRAELSGAIGSTFSKVLYSSSSVLLPPPRTPPTYHFNAQSSSPH
jgi:hypothetical protein